MYIVTENSRDLRPDIVYKALFSSPVVRFILQESSHHLFLGWQQSKEGSQSSAWWYPTFYQPSPIGMLITCCTMWHYNHVYATSEINSDVWIAISSTWKWIIQVDRNRLKLNSMYQHVQCAVWLPASMRVMAWKWFVPRILFSVVQILNYLLIKLVDFYPYSITDTWQSQAILLCVNSRLWSLWLW